MTDEPKTPQEPEAAGSACSAGLGTCGMCRFKGEEIERWDDDADDMVKTGFFQCQRVKHDPGYSYPKGEKAVVTDGSGYIGKLCVEADFGCVKFEKA